MLFRKPITGNTLKSSISLQNSADVHNGLLYAIQPFHERFPTLVPEHHALRLPPPTATAPFSLGLQPYLGHNAFTTARVIPSQFFESTALGTTPSAIGFLKILLVFAAGGWFFSTAYAGMTTCYAMGMGNVRRILEIWTIVLQRVWITFTLGLGATRLALLGEPAANVALEFKQRRQPLRWKSAWNVFQEQMGQTRKTAARGVQAIREEAKLYEAAVGAPSLVPLQHMVNRLMPFSLSTMMEESIKSSLSSMAQTATIHKMKLSSFTAGNKPPILQAARVYDIDNTIAYDFDVNWESQLEATVQIYTAGGLARVPVKIQHLQFNGVVRVIMTPLCKEPPGYGAILMSLPKPPKINMDVHVLGGEVTKLPFLRSEITTAMQNAISDQLLWPRRSVIPSMGGGNRPLLTPKQLDDLEKNDPLLAAEEALNSQQPMLRPLRDNTQKTQIFVNDNHETFKEVNKEDWPNFANDIFQIFNRGKNETTDEMNKANKFVFPNKMFQMFAKNNTDSTEGVNKEEKSMFPNSMFQLFFSKDKNEVAEDMNKANRSIRPNNVFQIFKKKNMETTKVVNKENRPIRQSNVFHNFVKVKKDTTDPGNAEDRPMLTNFGVAGDIPVIHFEKRHDHHDLQNSQKGILVLHLEELLKKSKKKRKTKPNSKDSILQTMLLSFLPIIL